MRLNKVDSVPASVVTSSSVAAIVILLLGCASRPEPMEDTVTVELQTGQASTKVVAVTLGEAPRKIVERCRPAQPYADDDPWISFPAAGGGMYVMFFDPGVGTEADSTDDRLIAVAKYTPSEPGGRVDGQPGVYLLPVGFHGQECSWDFLVGKGNPKQVLDGSATGSSDLGSR